VVIKIDASQKIFAVKSCSWPVHAAPNPDFNLISEGRSKVSPYQPKAVIVRTHLVLAGRVNASLAQLSPDRKPARRDAHRQQAIEATSLSLTNENGFWLGNGETLDRPSEIR